MTPDLETRIGILEAQVDALQAELSALTADMYRDGMGACAPPVEPRALAAPPPEPSPRDLDVRTRTSRLGRAGLVALATGAALLLLYALGRWL